MLSRFRTGSIFVASLVLSVLFTAAPTVQAQTAPNRGNILISEFRTRGPNGANDEFIEVYNNTDAAILVADSHPDSCILQVSLTGPLIQCGWAIVDPIGGVSGIPRAIVPAGVTIPARGHYLLASTGYSLSTYATADTPYDPPAYGDSDFTGLALYRTADRTKFTDADLLDAVGFDGIGSPYREGTGLQPSTGVTGDIQHSFVRKVSQTTTRPVDTDNNSNDFVFVATTAGATGTDAETAVLGAPGPESTTSPVNATDKFTYALFDTSRTQSQSPNRCYDATDTSTGAGSKGSLFIRRNITNTSAPVTQQRIRVIDITTVGSPGSTNTSQSIIKVVSSAGGTEICPNQLADGTQVAVQNTTLESPSPATGGGLNSSLAITSIPAGENRNVLFRLAAERTGSFRFFFTVEAK